MWIFISQEEPNVQTALCHYVACDSCFADLLRLARLSCLHRECVCCMPAVEVLHEVSSMLTIFTCLKVGLCTLLNARTIYHEAVHLPVQ